MSRKNARPAERKARAKLREKVNAAAGLGTRLRRPGGWPKGWLLIEESAPMTPAAWAALALRKERE